MLLYVVGSLFVLTRTWRNILKFSTRISATYHCDWRVSNIYYFSKSILDIYITKVVHCRADIYPMLALESKNAVELQYFRYFIENKEGYMDMVYEAKCIRETTAPN